MSAVPPPPQLFVRTVSVPDDTESLVRLLPPEAPLAWLNSGEGLVGWGTAARLDVGGAPEPAGPTDTGRFTRGAHWFAGLREHAAVEDGVALPGTGLVAFGTFTFAPASEGSALVVPQVLVGRRGGRSWMTTVSGEPDGSPDTLPVPFPAAWPVGPLSWEPGSLGDSAWTDAVSGTVERIRSGLLDKAVLARDSVAVAEAPIDVRTLLERLRLRYPGCFTFSVDGMVGATPELLLRREGDRLASLVLAGTRPRGRDAGEDRRLAEEMVSSPKDVEEHRLAVDSLRTALGPLSRELDVPDTPELLALANVQHLATPVSARLAPGVSALEAVAALHPTAAVGGTPTVEAMRLIAEVEGMDRGGYAGPVGWLDGAGNAEWGIALRSARVEGERARLFAGCGIVAGSDPRAELAETEAKFQAMREALTDPR
ncbi:isochorismate synthase MenF [Nocardiopsis sp. CNT312]|uniref:isochorismate synthase n=1 Tax=Nocardiopsis sp. CNT312 TaxID=1137268 RepID=UPI00049173F9|nr:isochorismate synthase [Nocardiopsis sp. CNT312]